MRLRKGIKKRLFFRLRRYHGGLWHNVDRILALKPGDLLHDCDGFNHRVKSIEFHKLYIDATTATCMSKRQAELVDRTIKETKNFPEKDVCGAKPRKKSRWFIRDVTVIAEDGNCFCGCGAFPEAPKPREEIEKYLLGWDCEKGREIIDQGAMNGIGDASNFSEMIAVLKEGGHVCDEDGIQLERFKPRRQDTSAGA